jgi:DNA polymerase-1
MAYASKGLTEDDAILQARMARILQDGDYNYATKGIRLWNPTCLYW